MRKHIVCLLLEGHNGLSSMLTHTPALRSKHVSLNVFMYRNLCILHYVYKALWTQYKAKGVVLNSFICGNAAHFFIVSVCCTMNKAVDLQRIIVQRETVLMCAHTNAWGLDRNWTNTIWVFTVFKQPWREMHNKAQFT